MFARCMFHAMHRISFVSRLALQANRIGRVRRPEATRYIRTHINKYIRLLQSIG